MAEKDIGSLVVMDGEELIGIITERHYSRNVILKGKRSPTTLDCRLILVDSFIIKMAERTQIQLQAVTHMFFSQAVPVQRSRSARLRLENARRS
jgi:predicted transcriptional regulator